MHVGPPSRSDTASMETGIHVRVDTEIRGESRMSLTGVWHGLYSYPVAVEPVYFVATLISNGLSFTGSTHESVESRRGSALTIFASLEGAVDGNSVGFSKTYLNAPKRYSETVHYEGALNADKTEIEGTWTIRRIFSGKFLMIRGVSVTEEVIREAFEPVLIR
jgi:hypothetical protein